MRLAAPSRALPPGGPAAALDGVLLVVPTLNEEEGLAAVLREARALGVETLVIDGGSTDRSREVARGHGVDVLDVRRGKGRAWQDFLGAVDYGRWDHVAMIDADGSYDIAALPLLLASGADMTVGLRARLRGSTPLHRRVGGGALSSVAGLLTLHACPDLLSGFRVIRSEALRQVQLCSPRFGLESELTIEFIRRGFRVDWVPVRYYPRYGTSKLRPLGDGLDILWTILRTRCRPL